MEAPVTRCLKCGKPRTKRWKLKDFCSYSCRGQHAVDTLDGTKYRTGLSGSRNLKKNKALQSLKRGAIAGISFAKINSITYRIDRPSKKGIGWLMEVAWPASGSRQRWVARDGDAASEPLPLEEAKRAAEELLNNRRKTKPRDHIRELNQIAANEVGRVVIEREKRTWPVDLMGGQRHRRKQPLMAIDPKLRQAILDTERILVDDERVTPGALQGDDYPIEMDGDGYPIMPACLRRTEETGLVPTIPSDVEEAA